MLYPIIGPSNKRKLNGTATADIFEKFIKILPKKKKTKKKKNGCSWSKREWKQKRDESNSFFPC